MERRIVIVLQVPDDLPGPPLPDEIEVVDPILGRLLHEVLRVILAEQQAPRPATGE